MAITNHGFAVGGGLPLIGLFITALNRLLGFVGFGFWVFLLYKAHGGQQFKIPLVGKLPLPQAGRD
jgi:uncharacterized membrane protein